MTRYQVVDHSEEWDGEHEEIHTFTQGDYLEWNRVHYEHILNGTTIDSRGGLFEPPLLNMTEETFRDMNDIINDFIEDGTQPDEDNEAYTGDTIRLEG